MFTSFVFANSFLPANASLTKMESNSFNNELGKDYLKEYSWSYTHLGDDGCAYTISISLTLDEEQGHVDYSEIYIETGCGNGNIFVHNGWSNYIHGRVQETNLNLIRQIGDGNSPVDANFIAQFNMEVENQINR